jgi:phosphopantetheinyl transferase (holo-ACP synthase)
MWILTGELVLPGRAAGLGVDFVAAGRVSTRLAERHFSARERATYPRALCFATREAVIKAVGGVGIPGAPLLEMELSHDPATGAPRFVAGARYLPVLEKKLVQSVALAALTGAPLRGPSVPALDDGETPRGQEPHRDGASALRRGGRPGSEDQAEGMLAVAIARGDGQASCHRGYWAVAVTSACLADLDRLDEDERRVVETRHDPLPSIANRLAARQAAAALGLGGRAGAHFSVRGGGAERPSLWDRTAGRPAAALLSLGHEGTLGIAAVLWSETSAVDARA